MQLSLKLSHKGLILVALPLVFQLIFIYSLYSALDRAEQERREAAQIRDISQQVSLIVTQTLDAAGLLYAYISSNDFRLLARFEKSIQALPQASQSLKQLVKTYPEGFQSVDRLGAVVERVLVGMEEARNDVERGDLDQARIQLEDLRPLSEELVKSVDSMTEFARKIEKASRQTQEHQRQMLKTILLFALVFNMALAIALVLLFNKSTSERLSVLVENSLRFARGEQLHPALSGKDELARLDHVFHEMVSTIVAAQQRRKEFIAMITHDLRAPLTSMLGVIGLIARGAFNDKLSEKTTDSLRVAENSINRMVSLISDLLDVEKLEAGQMDMRFEMVSLDALISASIEGTSGSAESKGVVLRSTQSDVEIYGDSDRLVRVLINLLSNAIKYSPGGSEIAVSVEEKASMVMVCVTDKGAGIPAEYCDKVFDRFQQVPGQARAGSTGLGLAICKLIVELHGGKIGVESAPGQGSKFWFTVPRTKSAMREAVKLSERTTAT